ncbi:hypothetical protein ACYVOU_002418 [Vibrio cholerae]
MSKKTLELGIYDLAISYSPDAKSTSAAISSNMKEEADDDDSDLFNAAVDGLESLILAHFMMGIDVSNPAYLEGIETAYAAISRQFSE